MALEIDESKKLDIPRLLRKRKWKGADVGRIVLADACISYNNALQAGASGIAESQVSAEQIDKMLATITDPAERDIYSGYLSINRWLSSTNPMAQAQQLQAIMHFNKMSDIVYNAHKAEDVYQYIKELPLIMTEKQYKETVEKQTYTGDTAIFEENRRAISNGIAILRPNDLLYQSSRIDESGYYKAPEDKLWKAITPFSLESFFKDYEDFQYQINAIANARNTFYASLYFAEGYNKILELIASMYKVEEVKLFQLDNAQFYRQIDVLNNSIYSLYQRIKETDYEDKELQNKKLEVIREYFKPLDVAKIEIPKGKLASARAHMKNFAGFRKGSLDPYIDLCIYDPNAVKDRPVKWDYPKKKREQDGN